jgi:hypothetical protein
MSIDGSKEGVIHAEVDVKVLGLVNIFTTFITV